MPLIEFNVRGEKGEKLREMIFAGSDEDRFAFVHHATINV